MTGVRRRFAESLRQRGHHAAFRIPPPIWDDDQWRQLTLLLDDTVATITRELVPREQAPARDADKTDRNATAASSTGTDPVLDEHALSEAATGLWRTRHKLTELAAGSRQARQASRHLSDTEAALAEVGLEIQDHDGTPYHSGLSVEVLVVVDDANVSAETIVETVRPSIYFNEHRIQLGQVVVGRPVRTEQEDPRA